MHPNGGELPGLSDDLDFGEDGVSTGGLSRSGAGGLPLGGPFAAGLPEGLNAKVLVLNQNYLAMRVVSARRAFCLLARNIAEVIHVDAIPGTNGQFVNYDFASWAELSILQHEFERGPRLTRRRRAATS